MTGQADANTATAPVTSTPSPLTLWIVVPCYNEEAVLPETARRLAAKLTALRASGVAGPESRILLVDDGSSDGTWRLIEGLHRSGIPQTLTDPGVFRGIGLAHNVGHQIALYAGLMHALKAGCDCAISLDADLQDDIDAMDEILAAHLDGAEIVYGVRGDRDSDSGFKRTTAEAFYALMRMLGVEMVSDSADYRLMGRRSLSALAEYRESGLFLRGIIPSLGFKTAEVRYSRAKRFAGESKYPLRKMVSFALEGVTSFSVAPIRLVTALGLLSVIVSVGMVVYALVSAIRGTVVAGWTSLMVSIWFVGGLIMVSLGIVGEYVGRAYLEAKKRPRYIIERILN
ncbi:MAG: glycosyltransferase family 2 protein [Collinsella sp.]|nr:glycosyltransferase family 2 protein [Collinsella sp.]